MSASAVRNVIVLIAMSALGGYYFARIASAIPQEWILGVNFVLAPAVAGVSTYFLLSGKPLTRLALVSVIPVMSILLAGGDPAKPGLELLLVAPLLIVCWLGAGASFAVHWLFTRSPKRA